MSQERITHLIEGLVGDEEKLFHTSAPFRASVTQTAQLMVIVGDTLASEARKTDERIQRLIEANSTQYPELIDSLRAARRRSPSA